MVEYCFDEESDATYSQNFINEMMRLLSASDLLNHVAYCFEAGIQKGKFSMLESTNIGLALLGAIKMEDIKLTLRKLKEQNDRSFGRNKVKLEIDEGSIFSFAVVMVRPRAFKIRKWEAACA
jgi:hypothetical protein